MPNQPKLKIIPLGGIDEIGKNITVYECEGDMIVVDCGSIFPKEDMLGIDLVIPDVSYLVANAQKLRGYVFTHGHEDHIGATPYVLDKVPAPIYGSRLTLALIDNKLREHRVSGIEAFAVEPRQVVQLLLLGAVHPGEPLHRRAHALAITCPAGTIVHSGDFKIDTRRRTPCDRPERAGGGGRPGVMALPCEHQLERPIHHERERRTRCLPTRSGPPAAG